MDINEFIKSASVEQLKIMQKTIKDEILTRGQQSSKFEKVITFTDGASRGNPGHAGVGVLLFNEHDDKLFQDYQYIGQCTNNEAEYRALLLALDRVAEITHGVVECFADSELLVRQMNGQYAIKSEKLLKFYDEVKQRIAKFKQVTFHHVPREHPKLRLADALANKAIDEAKPKIK
ncbi:MAG: ribonuclease HI family protein [Elusimicrobiota bacterium]